MGQIYIGMKDLILRQNYILLSRTFTKIAINNYDQIIVMSKDEEWINKIGSNVTSTIIPDPIDLELFKPSQNSKKIVRSTFSTTLI